MRSTWKSSGLTVQLIVNCSNQSGTRKEKKIYTDCQLIFRPTRPSWVQTRFTHNVFILHQSSCRHGSIV